MDEVPLEELTPMWANWERDPDRHFYVGETAHAAHTSGEYVIPTWWATVDGEEHAEVLGVRFDKTVSLKRESPHHMPRNR